jgi:hypothetical protein
MKKKTVKGIFIFFLCYLPLQYAVVGIVGYYKSEPWPAFVFPGFKSIYVYGGTYQINQYLVEVENRYGQPVRVFTPQQFFYEIPNSQVSGFLRANLDSEEDVNAFDTETRQWFVERAQELLNESVGDIYYLHKRHYLTRKENELSTDSVKVLNRVKIAESDNR